MKRLAKHNIGLRVRAARVQCGLTQEQLAASIGKTSATIANIENGRSIPNLYTLERLSQALNMRLRDFFEERDGNATDENRLKLQLRIQGMIRELDNDDLEIIARQIAAFLSFRSEQKGGD